MFDFLFKFNFMKQAIIATLMITPIFGLLGTMIIDNKLAFFSDALSHSAIAGLALGTLFSVQDPIFSMLIFAVIFGLCLAFIKSKNRTSNDTNMNIMSSTALSLGLTILSNNGFRKYSYYLIGNILSINSVDIWTFVVILTFGAGLCAIYNDMLIIGINRSIAKSKGINILFVENAFMVISSLFITASIKWVGMLTINSLLIIPAAAARNFAHGLRSYVAYSILISMISGIVGLVLSYYMDTAAGPTMTLTAATIFCISSLSNH